MTASSLPSRAADGRLLLARDGVTSYQIVVGEEGDANALHESAEFLAATIKRSTAADLPIVRESEAPPDRPGIYLGCTKAARKAGIPVDELDGWQYRMKVDGENLLLVGKDRIREVPHTENAALTVQKMVKTGTSGTYKAVTSLLEKFAGVRFVQPTSFGLYVPRIPELSVPRNVDIAWKPPVEYFVGRRVAPAPGKLFDPYGVANNFFGPYDYVADYGGHSYYSVVPKKVYAKTHPEYFAMIKGKRDPSDNHLCISNPDVRELMLKEVERRFDEGYKIISIGQTDGYRECECEKCQAIHPDVGEKLWIFHRQLAEEIKKRRPGARVLLHAYTFTTMPPRSFDKFPENVEVVSNRVANRDFFDAWRPFHVPMHATIPNWLGSNRFFPPRYSVDMARMLREEDVRGIYLLGGLDCKQGSAWGLSGPSYYAFAKALENPECNADDLEKEYVTAAFAEAAPQMLEFFKVMNRRTEFMQQVWGVGTALDRTSGRGLTFLMRPEDELCHFFPPANLKLMSDHLAQAESKVKDPDAKMRLALVAAEFALLKEKVAAYHMYRAYVMDPSWDTLKLVEKPVEAYFATLQSQQENRSRFAGYRQPYNGGAAGRFGISRTSTPPFSWDFAKIRESQKLPEANLDSTIRGFDGLPPYVFEGSHSRSQAGKTSRPPAATRRTLTKKERDRLAKEKLEDGKTPADQ